MNFLQYLPGGTLEARPRIRQIRDLIARQVLKVEGTEDEFLIVTWMGELSNAAGIIEQLNRTTVTSDLFTDGEGKIILASARLRKAKQGNPKANPRSTTIRPFIDQAPASSGWSRLADTTAGYRNDFTTTRARGARTVTSTTYQLGKSQRLVPHPIGREASCAG